jgi:hypothetical protein
MTLQETKKRVEESISSIFSKQDVINLLNNIAMDEGISENQIKDALDSFDWSNHVHDVSFHLSGNEICISDLDIDTRYLLDEIMSQ